MVKYTFSRINKGPVKHKVCFRLLINWMIDALISFAVLDWFLLFFFNLVFLSVLLIYLVNAKIFRYKPIVCYLNSI